MSSLADILSQTAGHFFVTTNISMVGVTQIATQECERQAMPPELLAGSSQFRCLPFNLKCPQELLPGYAGEVFQVQAAGRTALALSQVGYGQRAS